MVRARSGDASDLQFGFGRQLLTVGSSRHCARRGAWYFVSRVAKAHREFSIYGAAVGITELGGLDTIHGKISLSSATRIGT